MAIRTPPDRPPNANFEKARTLKGPLSVQLASFGEMMSANNPEAGKAYEELVEHLAKVEAGKNAPAAGDVLPPFLLPDENGHLVASDSLLADGPLVVSFNRGNWCPLCWLELGALQECYPAIRELGGSVVSITPEVATFSRRLKHRLGLGFPVLTDLDNGYALELGLAVALTENVREVYVKSGIDLGAFQRNDAWMLPLPATLVVGRDGIVRHAYVNEDFRERIEPSEIPGLLLDVRIRSGGETGGPVGCP